MLIGRQSTFEPISSAASRNPAPLGGPEKPGSRARPASRQSGGQSQRRWSSPSQATTSDAPRRSSSQARSPSKEPMSIQRLPRTFGQSIGTKIGRRSHNHLGEIG